jgi:hypothetical protein
MKEKQVKLPGPALKRSGRPDEVAGVIALLGCTKQWQENLVHQKWEGL